ncbi:MAG: hypothetical protein KDC39_13155 [Actinobacteria bacterium]|nr:hypothetical protein [Actinomycetota bacterium]
MTNDSFDRVRPRNLDPQRVGIVDGNIKVPDREGKRALFSEEAAPPALGSVALVCGSCDTRTVVSWAKALKLAFPSVPAVVPGTGVRVWMKCPACRDRGWVEVSLRS